MYFSRTYPHLPNYDGPWGLSEIAAEKRDGGDMIRFLEKRGLGIHCQALFSAMRDDNVELVRELLDIDEFLAYLH